MILPNDWNTSIVSTYKYNRIWEDIKFTNVIYKLFAFSVLFTHKPLLLSLAPSQKGSKITTRTTGKWLLPILTSDFEYT